MCVNLHLFTILKTENSNDQCTITEQILDTNNVTRLIYWKQIESLQPYDHGWVMWQKELDISVDREQWRQIRLSGYKISLSTNLKNFQYKILSKKLITNVIRHKWNPEVTPKCYCEQAKETTLHLMLECTKVRKFWETLNRWLQNMCNLNIKMSPAIIILNNVRGLDNQLQNTIILLAKHYIYATKCMGKQLKASKFAMQLYNLYVTEKEIAWKNRRVTQCKKKWNKYIKSL